MGYQSDGFCPWVKREVVIHNLPAFCFLELRSPKFNMEPKNDGFQSQESPNFQGLLFRFHVKFWGTSFPNFTGSCPYRPPERHKSKDSHRSRRQGSQLGTGSASVKLGMFGGGKISGPTSKVFPKMVVP